MISLEGELMQWVNESPGPWDFVELQALFHEVEKETLMFVIAKLISECRLNVIRP